jgi:hypothetical protein
MLLIDFDDYDTGAAFTRRSARVVKTAAASAA